MRVYNYTVIRDGLIQKGHLFAETDEDAVGMIARNYPQYESFTLESNPAKLQPLYLKDTRQLSAQSGESASDVAKVGADGIIVSGSCLVYSSPPKDGFGKANRQISWHEWFTVCSCGRLLDQDKKHITE